MKRKIFSVLFALVLVLSFSLVTAVPVAAVAATIEVSQPVQVTSDSHYERGQSIVYDGTNYWLFYGRSESYEGWYQSGDPDLHDYKVYYKKATSVADLAVTTPTLIPGANNQNGYLGETGAAYMDGNVWVFATIDIGASADLYGWYTDDGGSNWDEVGPIVTGLSDGQGHHDEIVFNGELWLVEGSGDFNTIHSATPKIGGWDTPLSVDAALTGGLVHFFVDGSDLYLAINSADMNYIYKYNSTTPAWDKVDENAPPNKYDPTLFKVGDNYVFAQAPWDGTKQYILAWSGATLDSTFFDTTYKMVTEGAYGTNPWVDMWPIGFTDATDASYLFFTSERNPNDVTSEIAGNIWYLEVDWDVTRDHFTYIQAAIDVASPYGTINVAKGTYREYLHITTDGLTIEGAGIDESIIDMDGLTPYWHYSGVSSSFASRAGVYITGYGSPDEIVEDVTFRGFTVKNVGLNPPITATGTHTGSDGAAVLTDSTASWTPDTLIDQWVHNLDDRYIGTSGSGKPIRSYGQITANTATTVTATLTGGLENDWDNGDMYTITPYEHFLDSSNKDGQDDIHGIGIANGKNVLIENVKVLNSGSRGISIGKARGTSLKQSEDITVRNCVVSDSKSNGISYGEHVGTMTVTGNTVTNNGRPHESDPTREYAGVGIYAKGENNSKKITGVISGNTVHNSGFEGIALYKYVDGVTIENNVVTGHNRDQDGAGIFFYYWGYPDRCKNVLVKNNIVTGNIRGIIAYYASASKIEGNTITTDSGAFPLGQGAIKIDGSNNIEVKDNIIGTSELDGTGISLVYWEGYGTVSSYANTFTGNTIKGAKFAGIFISGDAHDNIFEYNTITGTTTLNRWEGKPHEETQGDGVFIDDDAGTGNVFHWNKIYGNAGDGMENQTATVVDAENNWWGDASGPDGEGPGTGNGVSANVNYNPWYNTSGLTTKTYYVGSGEDYTTIQNGIDAALSDDTVSVAAGEYIDDENGDGDDLDANEGGLVADIYKSGLTLKSTDGPEVTIIKSRGTEGDGAVRIRGADDGTATTGVTVDGFTVYNTGTANSGAGIFIGGWFAGDMGHPANNNTVKNCIIGSATDQSLSPTNGVYLWNTTGNTIQSNIIYKARNEPDDFGCGIMAWGGLVGQAAPSPNTQIIDNEIYDSDRYGVFIGAATQQNFDNMLVRGNTITGSGTRGIGLWNVLGCDTIHINFNNIYDSVNEGMWVADCDATVDATYNWWGSKAGPYHVTANPGVVANMGDAVSDNVDFSPWLYKTQETIVPIKEPAYAQSVVLDNYGAYGWNTFSAPIYLDDTADTWAKLISLTGLDYSIAYRFDSAIQEFVPLLAADVYDITPGEGFFIKMNSAGSLPILYSTEQNLMPPSQTLTVEWNLIGLSSLADLMASDAFFTLAGDGQVISPTGNASPGAVLASSTVYVGEAYWVYMLDEETLIGVTTTPVNWEP